MTTRMETNIQNLGKEPIEIFYKSALTGKNISLGTVNAGESKSFDQTLFCKHDVVFVGGTWPETKKHEVRLDENS